MQSVIETPDFIRDARATGVSDDERSEIVLLVSLNPKAGTVIAGTGGARKLRFGRHNKGKSGGYRVITFYTGPDIPVFLLNVFHKTEKVNLSKSERNELRLELAGLADEIRKGVGKRV